MGAPTNDAPAVGRGWEIDEGIRTATLAAYDLDTLRGTAALREITDFAAALCTAPVALVSLVEEHRQVFIARTGTPTHETPRATSFCAEAMLGDDIMVVPDATRDPRFCEFPLVTGDMQVRFYAGVPLVTEDGVPLGSLCVIDSVPRDGLTDLQRQGLKVLAASVMARFRDTRDGAAWRAAENSARRAADDSDTRFRTLADTMPQMVWSTLPDGYHDYYNARWYEFTGMPPGSTDGAEWNNVFHPDDQERAWAVWRHSLASGDPYQIEYRLRHFDGTYRWVLGRALPIRGPQGDIERWFGTCTDIHEQKMAQEEREVISQELAHRIKNIFAVIAGLVGFTARARPEFQGIADDLRGRITALGRAHDFVRPHSSASLPASGNGELSGLLAELLAPYRQDDVTRFVIRGERVAIDDRSTTPLALLFHELATNAVKYGALSVEAGRVEIDVERPTPDQVRITWQELGGPPLPKANAASGFGSQLIDLSGVRQLGGRVERRWQAEGLVVVAEFAAAALSR